MNTRDKNITGKLNLGKILIISPWVNQANHFPGIFTSDTSHKIFILIFILIYFKVFTRNLSYLRVTDSPKWKLLELMSKASKLKVHTRAT